MAKKKFEVEWGSILYKAVGTGLVLAPLTLLTNMLLNWIDAIGFAWMENALLIVAGFLMVLALRFRKGFENFFEAMVSLLFMFGIWGLIGNIFGVNPVGALAEGNFFQMAMFFVLFFISEGIVQRLLKEWKLV